MNKNPWNFTFTNVDDLPELAGRVSRYLEADSVAFLRAFMSWTGPSAGSGVERTEFHQFVHTEHLRNVVDHHTAAVHSSHGEGAFRFLD